ncbi:hypothetical protein HK100_011547 [Physocladia obscura]|uniref:Phenylalanine--tRNA ligase, mitochondrial n=1 Tax=Physocladia obscura TaxID=109957 RepID=A0AAD5XE33_9FUNG|nr:hypothetical protein HK100_011547 [Physocladia obscura]
MASTFNIFNEITLIGLTKAGHAEFATILVSGGQNQYSTKLLATAIQNNQLTFAKDLIASRVETGFNNEQSNEVWREIKEFNVDYVTRALNIGLIATQEYLWSVTANTRFGIHVVKTNYDLKTHPDLDVIKKIIQALIDAGARIDSHSLENATSTGSRQLVEYLLYLWKCTPNFGEACIITKICMHNAFMNLEWNLAIFLLNERISWMSRFMPDFNGLAFKASDQIDETLLNIEPSMEDESGEYFFAHFQELIDLGVYDATDSWSRSLNSLAYNSSDWKPSSVKYAISEYIKRGAKVTIQCIENAVYKSSGARGITDRLKYFLDELEIDPLYPPTAETGFYLMESLIFVRHNETHQSNLELMNLLLDKGFVICTECVLRGLSESCTAQEISPCFRRAVEYVVETESPIYNRFIKEFSERFAGHYFDVNSDNDLVLGFEFMASNGFTCTSEAVKYLEDAGNPNIWVMGHRLIGLARPAGTRYARTLHIRIALDSSQHQMSKSFAKSISTESANLQSIQKTIRESIETVTTTVLGRKFAVDSVTNTSESVLRLSERGLHRQQDHPLNIVKQRIQEYFARLNTTHVYTSHDALHPAVTPADNFDSLLIPKRHPSRAKTDTYYLNSEYVLRTHSSAHQAQLLREHSTTKLLKSSVANNVAKTHKDSFGFLVTADVYRRDEVDVSHYPVFHQMEGVRLFYRKNLLSQINMDAFPPIPKSAKVTDLPSLTNAKSNPIQDAHSAADSELVALHLKRSLEGLVWHLFGTSDKNLQMRWIEGSFPFTSPSYELEVMYNGKWLELLGSGVMQQQILTDNGCSDYIGWAFGLGLERIAMVLFDIPDIRLFWSTDPRFLNQFSSSSDLAKNFKFQPYSKYPACYKDVSFWIPQEAQWHDNDFFQLVRDVAGDLAEDVALIDTFKHPKTGLTSKCFRINYRSMDKNLVNEEVDLIQDNVRKELAHRFKVELRG